MQAASDRESRYLHDQLAIVSPLLLALSAATPIHKGTLTNKDVRWGVISQSVDDRTCAERGEAAYPVDPDMVGGGVRRLKKSRYSSVSRYIGKTTNEAEDEALDSLNDIDAEVNEDVNAYLLSKNVDKQLAQHIAHLFTRDPLVIYDESIVLDDDHSQDHFENIQSTNWRTMCWKLPSLEACSDSSDLCDVDSGSSPGWRVEFRPLEIQLTDFENAAYAIFVVLVSRCILARGHNFYIPLSYVEENMERASEVDAVLTQKFWFNKNSFNANPGVDFEHNVLVNAVPDTDLVELSLDEIMNDWSGGCGLISSVLQYLELLGVDSETKAHLTPYISLLQKRASGELPTTARWIRNFVKSDPNHVKGSCKLSSVTADNLLLACEDLGLGKQSSASLNGDKPDERISSCRAVDDDRIFLGNVTPSYSPKSVCMQNSCDQSAEYEISKLR